MPGADLRGCGGPGPAGAGRVPDPRVSTNIPFLQAVIEDPDFIAGDISTAFIEQRPELLTTHAPADRGTRSALAGRGHGEQTLGEAPTSLIPG